MYSCVWPVGVVVAGATYYIANLIFPHDWEEVSEVRATNVTTSAQRSEEDVKAYDAEKNM